MNMGSQARKAFNLIKAEAYKALREETKKDGTETEDYLAACDNLIDLYASPGTHFAWNDYAKICLLTGCMNSFDWSFKNEDPRGAIACISFRKAITENACARFLSHQVVEAFEQTPLPELPPEVIDVLPHVHLMLPRKTVYDVEGDEVIALLLESGKLYDDKVSKDKQDIAKTFFPNEKVAPDEMLGAYGIQISTVTAGGLDVFQEFVTPEAKSWHESNVKYAEDSKYKDPNTEKIIRIAINSLLVHLYEPELITTDARPPSKGIGFSSGKKQPLAATWIGKTFKRKSERQQAKSDPTTKGNVRSHWRRGHWHTVLHGAGRQERRVQWFKPVYVNANNFVS